MRTGPPWPQALLEVLLLSGIPTQFLVSALLALGGLRFVDGKLSLPLLAWLTVLDAVVLVGLALALLVAGGESPRTVLIGVRPVAREVLRGFTLLPWIFVLLVATALLITLVAPGLVTHNPLAALATTRAEFLLFAAVGTLAAVREEIQRAFILHRCEQRLGLRMPALGVDVDGAIVGLVGFGVLFGLGHAPQGWSAVIITALLGTLWGVVYLRRRSIVAPTVSHASFNLLQVAGFWLLRS
jgi:membrane protease YdiL (CAAX protease family)